MGLTAPTVAAAFDQQVAWCASLGSPFTARVLGLLAEDLANGGPTAGHVGGWPGDPQADAVPLRLAAALHALVLAGTAPDLAVLYPPHPLDDRDRLRAALLDALVAHRDFVGSFLQSPPQTNEVGRSAVLLGGFHLVARRTGLPLRLLEIGASAGLNLNWDRYRYRLGPVAWGPQGSAVMLAPDWEGAPPPLAPDLRVEERAACDRSPIDLDEAEQRLRLRAYVWPDQRDRLDRLEAAVALARAVGTRVERADAAEWVPAQLARSAEGRATVLYHSIMWQYLASGAQERISRAVQEAGTRATATAPLAWLRFEPTTPDSKPELHLTLWPGGHRHRLAVARAHGTAVEWLQASVQE